jgi:hypothetical protein
MPGQRLIETIDIIFQTGCARRYVAEYVVLVR